MKRRIRTRILKAFLGVSITSMVAAGLAAGIIMLSIRGVAVNTNTEIGQNAAESSEDALIDQALINMQELSAAKAELIDSSLRATTESLQDICNFINNLYAYPGEFKPIAPKGVYQVPDGVLDMQWVPADKSISFDKIKDELYLHGNTKRIYESVMKVNPDINSIYYSSESGISIGYDANSAMKKEKDGSTVYYDGRGSDWYIKAKETKSLYTSDAYADYFGRGLTVTMSLPCYGPDGKFKGVVGFDISIEELNKDIQKTKLFDDGYTILLDSGRNMISAPGINEENKEDTGYFLGSNAEKIRGKMAENKNGAGLTEIDKKNIYAVWAPVSLTGWNYIIMTPYESIVAPAAQNRAQIESLSAKTAREMGRQILLGTLIFIALVSLIIAGVIYFTLRVSGNITHPISTLTQDVKQLGDGNFDYVCAIDTGDEIQELSLTFESMTKQLKVYIENLSRVTAEKERIGAELDVAKSIQASMLPCIFPAFPEMSEFDIYATMQPAKEVGGDFYDFFLIDSGHLGIVIADVSGKGVPAALFMVIAKTLIKNHAQIGETPSEIFYNVNSQLCENNDMNMFVTAFMGVLEISTGKFTFVNAGHNPPLIRRAGGTFEFLKTKAGFVLAGMDGIKYTEQETLLNKGDRLYLYTDGVTEATNSAEELFGEPRLVQALNKTDGMQLSEMLSFIKAEIDAFADGTEQFDDITMLVTEIS